MLQVVLGDLTLEEVDAIVNAANERLAHGGGVAGAIVRRGGDVIQRESRAWVREHGPVETGTAAITGGGRLRARYVIHAVGPIWRDGGDEPALLRSAVQRALAVADEHNLRSVSMPAISSGIFGFPKPLAAKVIVGAVVDYFTSHEESEIEVVRFCNIDAATTELFLEELRGRVSCETRRDCPGYL
ncbi:MAG: macro domain-containing protein [Anaerolineae bacterium]|nr:macro domain-containing protein [Anaerolineae bacterium]